MIPEMDHHTEKRKRNTGVELFDSHTKIVGCAEGRVLYNNLSIDNLYSR